MLLSLLHDKDVIEFVWNHLHECDDDEIRKIYKEERVSAPFKNNTMRFLQFSLVKSRRLFACCCRTTSCYARSRGKDMEVDLWGVNDGEARSEQANYRAASDCLRLATRERARRRGCKILMLNNYSCESEFGNDELISVLGDDLVSAYVLNAPAFLDTMQEAAISRNQFDKLRFLKLCYTTNNNMLYNLFVFKNLEHLHISDCSSITNYRCLGTVKSLRTLSIDADFHLNVVCPSDDLVRQGDECVDFRELPRLYKLKIECYYLAAVNTRAIPCSLEELEIKDCGTVQLDLQQLFDGKRKMRQVTCTNTNVTRSGPYFPTIRNLSFAGYNSPRVLQFTVDELPGGEQYMVCDKNNDVQMYSENPRQYMRVTRRLKK